MSFLFGRPRIDPLQAAADRLHDTLISQIRQPVFYTDLHVPDTFEGRFDLLVLHAALALRRLQKLGPDGRMVAQHLVDTMFARFDVALREMGVSDVGVPKRMKRLAEAFKGRTAAYEEALAQPDGDRLAAAVGRNVLAGAVDGAVLARYARALDTQFEAASLDDFVRGGMTYPDAAAAARLPT